MVRDEVLELVERVILVVSLMDVKDGGGLVAVVRVEKSSELRSRKREVRG